MSTFILQIEGILVQVQSQGQLVTGHSAHSCLLLKSQSYIYCNYLEVNKHLLTLFEYMYML